MSSTHIGRRPLGAAVLIAMAAVSAAPGHSVDQAPSTTPPSSSPSSSPTEKGISPTGGNLFSPPVKAPPAQTVSPGRHPGLNGIP
jgi:hypothetical protein